MWFERCSRWLTLRAGVSRCAWMAAAVGLAFAGVECPPVKVVIGVTGLVLGALVVAVIRSGVGRGGALSTHGAPFLLIVLSLTAGASWGAVRVDAQLRGELASMVGARSEIVVEVIDSPRDRGNGVSFSARSLGPRGVGEHLLIEMTRGASGAGGAAKGSSADGDILIQEGAILVVRGLLRAPESPTGRGGGSGFDERAWLAREGIGVVMVAEPTAVRVLGRREGLAGALDRLRTRARVHLAVGIDPVTSSMLRGILLGDKADIPDSSLDAFRRSGIAHILAVSGLHVGALAAFVMLILQGARAAPWVRTLAGSVTVVLFALLTGAGPSVTRASVMVITMLLARFVGRGRDTWAALGLAAVVVLARDPGAAMAPGFQLSFSAVAALLLLTRPLEQRLIPRLPPRIAQAVAVSLAATIGTAPVSLLTFGQVSLVGVAANPLVVPLVPLIMALGLGSVALGFASPLLSGALNTAAGVLVGWVSVVAALLAKAPVMTMANAASVLMGVVGAFLGSRAATARYRDGSGSSPRRRAGPHPVVRVVAGLIGGVLLGTVPLGVSSAYSRGAVWWAARDWPEMGEVRVLDVGEGNAVLVRTPQGSAVLIDGGPAQADLLDDLLHLGVGRLDVLVVSHPHADHFGGLAEVVRRIPVGLFVDQVEEGAGTGVLDTRSSANSGEGSAMNSEAEAFLAVREAALAAGAQHVLAGDDATLTLGDVSLEFDAPEAPLRARADGGWARARAPSSRDGPALSSEGLNTSSVVVIVRLGGLGILVPGDAEAAALAGYTLTDVDCVVVPHHGSRGAVTSSLLGALSPEVAVISVGADNPFGHPESGTIETIENAGVRLFRTDLSGSVSIAPSAGGESGMRVGAEKVAGGGIGVAAGRSRR